MEVHQYCSVHRNTKRTTTRSFAKRWRLDVITALTTNCNKIWRTGEWPTPWPQSLVITHSKKGNLQQCQNYRTISPMMHSSKVMLKIILNRLKPQAEKIIAEEEAGFRAGRSTTEQIFNLRILCEKYLQHQQDLYHVFIDLKKAFTRSGMQPPKGGRGCIMSPPCLESEGCHLIPLCYLLSCSST